ncbi:Hydroxyacyl dehydrogenase [Aspergillus mulundensis]|uniref:Hydroxyacyl dehydrogenase n=1 Tax=Aspergillus mulundensis TaxID=1810919 RepID=A0A3D8T6I9_9EURO|nr:Hydroxyacyl dehydrogenase [Aspergillus mulundensis]RDW94177.1 Hydroxyacyl dehydrogenase [Aspergillus mulundensis]
MSTILITGSSRGLGLELVRQFSAQAGKQGGLVIATARSCSPALKEAVSRSNGLVVFVALDLADEKSVTNSAYEVRGFLQGRSLDILINCAGVYSVTSGKTAEMPDLDYQLSVNVVGAHNVLRQYIPLMQNSDVKKVINISSGYGSLALAQSYVYAPCPAYKISKAALNALTVQYALSYKDEGFTMVAVNPGWLQSDMGGENADLTVAQGAEAVMDVVMSLKSEDNGCFKSIRVPGWDGSNGRAVYDGKDLLW